MMNEIKIVQSFKPKDKKKMNWVIQLPAKYYTNILNKGRSLYDVEVL